MGKTFRTLRQASINGTPALVKTACILLTRPGAHNAIQRVVLLQRLHPLAIDLTPFYKIFYIPCTRTYSSVCIKYYYNRYKRIKEKCTDLSNFMCNTSLIIIYNPLHFSHWVHSTSKCLLHILLDHLIIEQSFSYYKAAFPKETLLIASTACIADCLCLMQPLCISQFTESSRTTVHWAKCIFII